MSEQIQRTLYAALGLEDDDRATMIRGAYRDLARRYHPARVGPGGQANFRAIADAYRVLSDTSLRRRYDEVRARAPIADAPEAPAPGPEVTSLRRAVFTRAADGMFARIARNFSGVGVPKSESVDCLRVCFVIAPRQADEGVVFRLGLPVLVRCEACAGRGATALVQCRACDGEGLVEAERTLDVTVSPGGGAGGDRSLEPLGIYNLFLRALVRLDPDSN